MRASISSLLLGLAGLGLAAPDATTPVVDLGYVKYTGFLDTTTDIVTYRGVPYAQPPTGNLRWRAPLPIEFSSTYGKGKLVQATTYAPFCYQSIPFSLEATLTSAPNPSERLSEDCLVLNVLTPRKPKSKALPVIVAIHGGGYTTGGPYIQPGDSVVYASQGGVIYVEMQYRLGVFGFLGGSAIAGNGNLNTGLLDQRLALDWVQRHISAFGGDPNRVTIWGGSAGGGSVTLQMTAFGGQGKAPFSAAIAEYPWWTPLLSGTDQNTQFANTLKAANCKDLACLRALPSAQLGLVGQKTQNISYPTPGLGYGLFYFGPVVDGVFVQSLPDRSFKTGAFFKVPLLVDRDEMEGFVFSNRSLASGPDETIDAQYLFPSAGPSFFSRLYQLYPAAKFANFFQQRQTWFGDFIINCPTYQMASHMVDQSPTPQKVYKMRFTAGGGLHAATSAYLTSRNVNFPDARNKTLAEIMVRYFVSFAEFQDPNPGKLAGAPYWPSYSSDGNGISGLAEESIGFRALRADENRISTEPDPDARPECDFFSSQGQALRN